MEEEDIRPFWTTLVKPGEIVKVNFPDSCFLTITNVCMPELPSDEKDVSPVRLVAKVQNDVSQSNTASDVLLASLIPHSSEFSQINNVFTPLNEVSLTVSGSTPLQVSGILQPLVFDEEEEEEEAHENQD